MVNTNKKGFTLVELIIVIAVIGVLAAILIPVFSNVIEKANAKSAMSDAKNALTLYITSATNDGSSPRDSVIIVEKANKFYTFGYTVSDGSLVCSDVEPCTQDELSTRSSNTFEALAQKLLNEFLADGTVIENEAPVNETEKLDLPEKVGVYSGYTLITNDANKKIHVNITISDKGNLVMPLQNVTVYDIDSDGRITIFDALKIAHKENCPSGEDGLQVENTDYGLSITKLWGRDNAGGYGYYLNNKMPTSLTTSISNNDYIYAFNYIDPTYWSDAYTYFSTTRKVANVGDEVKIQLFTFSEYDAAWQPVFTPFAGATITINGTATGYTTDSEGYVTIPMTSAGTFTLSAESTTGNITPPICIVEVH